MPENALKIALVIAGLGALISVISVIWVSIQMGRNEAKFEKEFGHLISEDDLNQALDEALDFLNEHKVGSSDENILLALVATGWVTFNKKL